MIAYGGIAAQASRTRQMAGGWRLAAWRRRERVERLRAGWGGPAWRWWSLAAGVLLLALTALGVLLLDALGGVDRVALLTVLLIGELVLAGLAGSGMLDGLAHRAIAGGMARQPQPEPLASPRPRELDAHDRHRRDRRTIRSALIALPLLAAVVLLLIV